jgi:molybdenum cofactor cytidylyltransferase
MIIGIVQAAGRGSRFAEADPAAPPKMLAPIDGVPMVRRTVESLVNGGIERCVVVVSAAGAPAVSEALEDLPVSLVINPDPSRGMFSSVQCGVTATDESDLCVLLPGDMPFVQPSTIAAVIAEGKRSGRSVAPSLDGHPGHPVVCSSALRARIIAAPVDSRLDCLMADEAAVHVKVADAGVRRDMDRPTRRSVLS